MSLASARSVKLANSKQVWALLVTALFADLGSFRLVLECSLLQTVICVHLANTNRVRGWLMSSAAATVRLDRCRLLLEQRPA